MQPIFRMVTLGIVLAVAFPVRLPAQPADPVSGTWELNLAKSKFSPGPPLKSQTRTYEFAGPNVKYTAKGIDAEGKPTLVQYTATYDGKDYPMTGSADSDAISLKRIDAVTVEFTQKKAGKVVITGTRVISDGGKVMTVTSKGTNAKGQMINNVLVLEKR